MNIILPFLYDDGLSILDNSMINNVKKISSLTNNNQVLFIYFTFSPYNLSVLIVFHLDLFILWSIMSFWINFYDALVNIDFY